MYVNKVIRDRPAKFKTYPHHIQFEMNVLWVIGIHAASIAHTNPLWLDFLAVYKWEETNRTQKYRKIFLEPIYQLHRKYQPLQGPSRSIY